MTMKPSITIEYCPKCGWLLRAAYMAQEILTTFNDDLKSVTLQPSEIGGSIKYSLMIKEYLTTERNLAAFPR